MYRPRITDHAKKAKVVKELAARHEPVLRPPPPPGVPVYFQNDLGQPCESWEAVLWCWAGGPTWYRITDHLGGI